MKNFITNLTKNDKFFKDRKIKSIENVNDLTKDKFPSTVSYNNAVKFVNDYKMYKTTEKVLLTYEIYQPKKNKYAMGFKLFLKLDDNLYIILDRRESQAVGAGQLLVSYMDGKGNKLGSIQFHKMECLFDGISSKYDKKELIDNLSISPEARDIFIF